MSARSQNRRQARQAKTARRWSGLTEINKKGCVPARMQPLETDHHDIMKPSRKGLAALPE